MVTFLQSSQTRTSRQPPSSRVTKCPSRSFVCVSAAHGLLCFTGQSYFTSSESFLWSSSKVDFVVSWREAWTGCWSHRDPVPPLLVQGHKNAVHRLSQVESRAASSSVILQLGFVPPLAWEYRRPFWCMGLRCQGPREMETVCVP